MELIDISRYMCLILRHKPGVIGITLDSHGWADTRKLVEGIAKKHSGFNMEMLEEIVRTDNKQRYSLSGDKTRIRANQGHSVPVDVELKKADPPEILYHGTAEKYAASIRREGIISKQRLYVHLSKDEATAVTVGKRHGKPVVFEVKSGEMQRDGYEFFLSENGVWLTKRVPASYLRDHRQAAGV